MDATRRKRIEALFEAALDVPEPRRDAWLAGQCAGDPELEAEVRQLLAAHERAGILDLNAIDLAARLQAPQDEDRRIGPYRIVRELGRGGMAVVYLAVREDGQFRQRVALKLLRGSPDADELYARFLAERQILAALQHPNISQMLDGGITDGQLPYLVMEYVEGVPITEYCDRRHLGIDARLRLLLDVCSAVQHAHKNLVLHCDLKPANILVTDDGQVKLLDFGMAKLLNPLLSEQPITRTDLRVLTPEYASPEQIRGETLSTASDVYSLGVVLYEMLTGRPPYTLTTHGLQETAEFIIERDPERPSAAVVSRDVPAETIQAAAAARGTTPERLRRVLHGDLDAIVARALRKEATLRYGTAEMLADDIARYLGGLPVLATRGSRGYRARKFLRRNRVQALAGVLVLTSLSTGAGVAFWQATSAHRAHYLAQSALEDAERALQQSEAITSYLISLFEAGNPTAGAGVQLTAQDLLRRGIRRADELAHEPLVQAAMLEALGRVQRSLGEYAEARVLLERSLLIREQQRGGDHPELANTLVELADVLRLQGMYPEALQRAERALRIRQSAQQAPHAIAETQIQVAALLVYLGDMTRATALVQQAVDTLETAEPPDAPALARALMRLGSMHQRVGDYANAEAVFRRMLDHTRRSLPADDPLVGDALLNIGYVLLESGNRLEEAEQLIQAGLEVRRRSLGPSNPLFGHALGDLAQVQLLRGKYDEAIENLRQHVVVLERAYGPDYPIIADGTSRLADGYREAGRLAEAERAYEKALAIAMRTHGPDHTATAGILSAYARLRLAQKRYAEAEEHMRRAISIRERALGPNVGLVGYMKGLLAEILIAQDRYVEAESLLKEGIEYTRQSGIRPIHRDYQALMRTIVQLYERWGRPELAQPYRSQIVGR